MLKAITLTVCLLAGQAHAEDPALIKRAEIKIHNNAVEVDCGVEPWLCEASSNHPTTWRSEPWFKDVKVIKLDVQKR
jgi:hypothetical protein